MGRRALPVLLVVLGAVADSTGAHALARDAVFAALPFASVAALVAFGEYVDSPERVSGLHALCYGLIVALLVLSCALRSSAVHGAPPLAVSSLLAVAALFALKGALAAAPLWRRLGTYSPVKP